jgi:hypothetical protein
MLDILAFIFGTSFLIFFAFHLQIIDYFLDKIEK